MLINLIVIIWQFKVLIIFYSIYVALIIFILIWHNLTHMDLIHARVLPSSLSDAI